MCQKRGGPHLLKIIIPYLSWATISLTSLLKSFRVLDAMITVLVFVSVDASIQMASFCTSDYMMMTVADV